MGARTGHKFPGGLCNRQLAPTEVMGQVTLFLQLQVPACTEVTDDYSFTNQSSPPVSLHLLPVGHLSYRDDSASLRREPTITLRRAIYRCENSCAVRAAGASKGVSKMKYIPDTSLNKPRR